MIEHFWIINRILIKIEENYLPIWTAFFITEKKTEKEKYSALKVIISSE